MYTARHPMHRLSLGALLIYLLPSGASGQEVQWRHDYNAARHEAQTKDKPLVLDFSTENCFWCSKLDATTFRNPRVAKMMNEQFVPLHLDAGHNTALVQVLQIHAFPTILLAAPDGKILATLEGYQDAMRFADQLQRALDSLKNPEWMTRDFDEAARAAASSDHARALALLKNVASDGKNRPVQLKARAMLADLEQQAAGRLARAKQLDDKGQTTDALDTLSDLLRAYPGTQAATEGGQMLTVLAAKPEVKVQQRTRRARELLAQARDDFRTRQYLSCMDHCETLASAYADLPEGSEAAQLLNELRDNPNSMRQACDALSDRLGTLYLATADTWIKKGQPQQAAICLERVVQSLPGTHQAEIAQARLAQINGQPTQPAQFQRP